MENEFNRTKSPYKLIIIFLLLCVASVLLGNLYFIKQRNIIITEIESELISIAKLKKDALVKWKSERMDDANVIAQNKILVENIAKFLNDPNRITNKKEIVSWMQLLNKSYDYNDIFLLDSEYKCIFENNVEPHALGDFALKTAREAGREKRIIFSDLHRNIDVNDIHIDLIIPLFLKDEISDVDSFIGTIILRIDPSIYLFGLIQSWPGKSKTAESLLVKKEGDKVIYLNELRHRKNTALKLFFSLSNKNLPAVRAVEGYEGIVFGTDYRSKRVIAATIRIPTTSWYMVCKMDLDEVEAPIRKFKNYVIFVVILLLASSGLVLALIWRRETSKFYQRQYEVQLEKYKIEKALREKESQAKAILDATLESLILLDRNYNIISINETAAKRLNSIPDDMIGKTFYDVLNPELAMSRKSKLEQVFKTKQPVSFIDERNNVVFNNNIYPLLDNDGEVVAIVIFSQDITKQKKAEDELRESQRKITTLLGNLQGMAYRCKNTPDWYMEFVSDGSFELTGYKPEELMFNNRISYGELIHKDDAEDVWDTVQNSFKAKKQFQILYRIITASGDIKWVWEKGLGLYDEDGKLTALEGFIMDISERIKFENELKLTRDLLSKINDCLLIKEPYTGRILDVNDATCLNLGYSKDELLKMRIMDIDTQLNEKNWREHENLARKSASLMLETIYMRKDGSSFPAEVNIRFLSIEGKEYFIATARDITERKRIENALKYLNVELENKNKELAQVIYVASHDLRSPLVNVQGFSKELRAALNEFMDHINLMNVSPDERRKIESIIKNDIMDSLAYILSSISQMDKLLAGLLKISRLGRIQTSIERINTKTVVQDIIRANEFVIEKKGVKIIIEELSDCLCDLTQITQVFSNLIVNAIKYLDPSRPAIIKISSKMLDDEVIYSVEDNGIGILPEHQGKIFDLFYRLSPDLSEGEGLGLTIVRTIINKLRGRVWVESEYGKGSKFSFSLPKNILI